MEHNLVNNRTGLFLQARINSNRLFRKILLPLKGGLVLEHVMRALRGIKADVYALLTTEHSFRFLKPYAEAQGFKVFIGSSWNVLGRYAAAARKFQVDRVIRATGDNPLVSAKLGNSILELHKASRSDLSHYLGPPLGTGVEVIEAAALFRAEKLAQDEFEREHITTYHYRHREQFKILEKQVEKKWALPKIKISLDTLEDYRLITTIFLDLYENQPIEIDSLAAWIKKEYPSNESIPFPQRGTRQRNRTSEEVSAS